MNNLKRVGINMISGGVGFVIPMAINFFSTPYVIKILGKEAFGLQVLGNVIIGYLIVADMGLDIPITKKIAEYYAKNDEGYKSKFLIATIKLYFIIGLLGTLIVFLFTEKLISLLAIPSGLLHDAKLVFYMTSIGFMGSIINMWGKAVFNGIHRYDLANAVSIFNNLFGVIIGILLLVNGYGVIGFFSARIVGLLVSGLIYIFLARKLMNRFTLFPIIDYEVWSYLKEQIGYGFVLRLSGMIFSRMDQTLISSYLGVAVLTVYSIPILIANTLSGLIASVTHFAFPMASSMSFTRSISEMEPFFIRISKFITIISTLVFVPFIIFGDKFLALWISTEVSSQSHIVLVMLLSAFYINTCFTIAIIVFMVGIGQLKTFTFYGATRGILLMINFAFLIKFYGLEGAGYSYIISLVLDFAFLVYCLRNKLKFNIRAVSNAHIKPIALGLFLGTIMFFLRSYASSWINLLALITSFPIAYCIIGWLINLFDHTEKEIIYKLVNKIGFGVRN
ncbi:MAG TPA: MATE family efflux transporter [Cyclobacteriaceae bacterium]|jgi:O-antigen/teichoic acid export membrane protein|nr:MATE family efflux transporter [Cyclobacteriaceae bacterium]